MDLGQIGGKVSAGFNKQMKEMQLQIQKDKAAAEAKRVADLKAQGLNPDGSPIKPGWEGITNPDGSLGDQYVLGDWNEVTADQEALNKYKETALRDAGQASPWASMMLQKQEQEQLAALDNAAQMQASGYNQALSTLAQTGGVSGGARERMARSSANSGMLGRQAALRDGTLDRMNIGLQDETNRMDQLGNLQGMQNTQADIKFKNQEKQLGIDQTNLNNRLGEVDKKRMYDLDSWKQQMQTWGANKSADAQAKAAGSGGKK
ncbi:hypothetical protein D3C87_124930 [compost metagenome]